MSNGDKFWYFVGLLVASPTNVLGLFLLLMVAAMLAWAQFGKSKVDFTYLLVDPAAGQVTLAKFAGFGAFVTSTWVFVALTANGKFDGGYAWGYLLTWAGVKVASDIKQAREGGAAPPPSNGEPALPEAPKQDAAPT